MPWDEQAELFRRKASEDEIALLRLVSDPDQPESVIGFHAQQAVEKLLKALLTHRRMAFRRTHDLSELIDLCKSSDLAVPGLVEEARKLQPYAVSFRYEDVPDEPAAPLERAWAVACVTSVRHWVESQMASGAAP